MFYKCFRGEIKKRTKEQKAIDSHRLIIGKNNNTGSVTRRYLGILWSAQDDPGIVANHEPKETIGTVLINPLVKLLGKG